MQVSDKIIQPVIEKEFKKREDPNLLENVSIKPVDSTTLFGFFSNFSVPLIFKAVEIEGKYSYEMMEKSLLNKEGNTVTSFTWDGGAKNESVVYVSNALKGKHNQLVELILANISDITDESIKYLSDALKNENCKLTRLVLIPDVSVFEKVAEVNSGNECKIMEEGIRCLCDALKHEQCKLEELYLSRYDIAEEGFKYLTDALRNENCKLKQLGICNDIAEDHRIVDSPACAELYRVEEEKNIAITHRLPYPLYPVITGQL